MGQISNATLSLVFPPVCAFCEESLDVGSIEPQFCLRCERQEFTPTESSCPHCGAFPAKLSNAANSLPNQAEATTSSCKECSGRKYAFDRVFALGRYAGGIQSAVVKMKTESGQSLAMALGRRLGDHLERCDWRGSGVASMPHKGSVAAEPHGALPTIVTCVPKYWLKRVLTGVNSPETIMKGLAKQLGLPPAPDLLVCKRAIEKQSLLGPEQRIRNVKSAWSVNADFDIHAIHVIIVDDTMTTGATANEAARVLKRAGCKRVSLAVIGRATNW